jgi:hypothetical protein
MEKKRDVDIYLDRMAGKDKFLDNVAYYFDAKPHGFSEIDGVLIKNFRKEIIDKILFLKKKYQIT